MPCHDDWDLGELMSSLAHRCHGCLSAEQHLGRGFAKADDGLGWRVLKLPFEVLAMQAGLATGELVIGCSLRTSEIGNDHVFDS